VCGRFCFFSPAEAVARLFGVDSAVDYPPRYNIAPTQDAPAVRATEGGREFVALRWGLVPFWARDAKIGNRMINARGETVAGKPAFRDAFRRRRCLVLADGFYEWQKTTAGKQPWLIAQASGEPFAMAGLWEVWRGTKDGGAEGEAEPLETCTIITTGANAMMRRLHDRMPVILDADGAAAWLDPATGRDALQAMLVPAPDGVLQAVPVSRRVNSPANDDPALIEAVAT
jgi:putative SOS response-associated peptidase YedK